MAGVKMHYTGKYKCNYCGLDLAASTSTTRLRAHLTREPNFGIRSCPNVPDDVRIFLCGKKTATGPSSSNPPLVGMSEATTSDLPPVETEGMPEETATDLPPVETEGMPEETATDLLPPVETEGMPEETATDLLPPVETEAMTSNLPHVETEARMTNLPPVETEGMFLPQQHTVSLPYVAHLLLGETAEAQENHLRDDQINDMILEFESGANNHYIPSFSPELNNDFGNQGGELLQYTMPTHPNESGIVENLQHGVGDAEMEGNREDEGSAFQTKRLVGEAFVKNAGKIWSWLMDDQVLRVVLISTYLSLLNKWKHWCAVFLHFHSLMKIHLSFDGVAYYYFFSSQVRWSIVYGDQPRNRLDFYLPTNLDKPKPVVAFVTGGAWIIGYKAWGSLLGRKLAERDILVACIDYRNFPQGTISDMVTDASNGISFICNHIAEYGGDPNRIYLMGQSAGAHISACALLEQAIREAKGESISWSVSKIKAYFGLSGGYNLLNLVDHFNNRGLYRSLFLNIMEGEDSLLSFSPEVRIEDPSIGDAISLLPPIHYSFPQDCRLLPSAASETFVDVLQRLGAQAELILYEGKTHTDLFLQDPLRGGKDDLFEHVVATIHAGDEEALAKDAIAPPGKHFVPEILLRLAHHISPF